MDCRKIDGNFIIGNYESILQRLEMILNIYDSFVIDELPIPRNHERRSDSKRSEIRKLINRAN
jgi:hypothetical protein